MSGTSGKNEALSSLKKPEKEEYAGYRFAWVKEVIDLIYRPAKPE